MSNEDRKLPKPPKPEEQIRPEALLRVIKKGKATATEKLKDIPATPANYKKFKGETSNELPRGILWGVAGLIVLFIVGFIVSFSLVKQKAKASLSLQVSHLQAGVTALQNFNPQAAEQEFSLLSQTSTMSFGNVLGIFGFLFHGGSGAISSFQDLGKQLTALSQESDSLSNGLFDAISNSSGANLISTLTNVRATLGAIDTDSGQLSGVLSSLGGSSALSGSTIYLPLKAQIEGGENFLDAFIPWLSSPTPHHVLVLLQNSSEMRPGGGFLGSYADVTIASGTITNISVHDIADVDAAFTGKIVPPQPLQLEVQSWRPADANWFFDFPTSASKTIQFFEASDLYNGSAGSPQDGSASAASTSFDGVIAISPKVISDLLSLTGPITISSTSTKPKIPSTTFTSDNLLIQIQNIVQQGQAASPSGNSGEATYPKAVLGLLSQKIFEQLASSTPAEKQQLLSMALDWVNKRDVMAYFKNPTFENFLASYDAAGDVYQLPQNFNGDYLAIVDADINADKSELYINQQVALDSQINADGTITDNLTITRTHTGNQSQYWWYQTTNQDYLQIFVPDGSSLTNETGGIKKTINPPVNYIKDGYSTDPTIVAIQSTTQPLFIYPAVTTHEESGKEVFATWSRVAKGNSTELEFDYTHSAFLSPAAGTAYQFIFEKQAGTNRSYDFEIDAPLGYVFAENGLATYEYTSDDPPGRLIINLTLQKI